MYFINELALKTYDYLKPVVLIYWLIYGLVFFIFGSDDPLMLNQAILNAFSLLFKTLNPVAFVATAFCVFMFVGMMTAR